MAMTVAEPTFIDTNVLIYTGRPNPRQIEAERLLSLCAERGGTLWVSRQILREYLAATTRPQSNMPALPIRTAIADVQRFSDLFEIAEDGEAVTGRLLDLLARHPTAGKQVHDANIVATMQVYGLRRLLTFNSADFQRYVGVIELVAG